MALRASRGSEASGMAGCASGPRRLFARLVLGVATARLLWLETRVPEHLGGDTYGDPAIDVDVLAPYGRPMMICCRCRAVLVGTSIAVSLGCGAGTSIHDPQD